MTFLLKTCRLQEETEPTKLPAEKPSSSSAVQKRKVNTRRRSLDVASGSGYQRTSPGARRKTMTVIDQPILEEPEDAGILNEEDTGVTTRFDCLIPLLSWLFTKTNIFSSTDTRSPLKHSKKCSSQTNSSNYHGGHIVISCSGAFSVQT